MRKASIILVLASIFFSEAGYVIYYGYQQYSVKKQVKRRLMAGLDERFLEVINLDENKDSMLWEEEGKEFLLHENMYDIVRTSVVNGVTYLHCLNDTRETSLKKKINNLAGQGSRKPATERNKHLLKLQLTDFLLSSNTISFYNGSLQEQQFLLFQESTLFMAHEIVSPPPQA